MKRHTAEGMDFEYMFCDGCPYHGEPNGCNTPECTMGDACDFFVYAAERLKQYEDIGLTPEEIGKLAEARKDGRLVELPCKIWDDVYITNKNKVFACEVIGVYAGAELEYKGTTVAGGKIACMSVKTLFLIDFCDFGKTVFLTREEAEIALKEGSL